MDESTGERWLPVVGYEGLYEVSDRGRVRSLDRAAVGRDGRRYRVKGRVRKVATQHYGHLKVMLIVGGSHRGFHVHTLVLTAFVGPKPEGLCARHLNGVPHDNRLENLAWGTYSENKFDQVRHGTDAQASKTHCIHGHPFDDGNTYVYRQGNGWGRGCKECRRNIVRRRRARLKESAA